ncbi:MAG TPA: hypothetical protein VGM27_30485 [Acidobacteriaceae bacterium]
MAKRGHSEEEILRVLRGAESGMTVVEVLPETRHQPAELLFVEEEVCKPWVERTT